MRKELNCVGGIINRVLGIRGGGEYITRVFLLKNNESRNIVCNTRLQGRRSATLIHENSERMNEGNECYCSGLSFM